MTPRQNRSDPLLRSGDLIISEVRGNRKYGNLGVDAMSSGLEWGSNIVTNKVAMTSDSNQDSSSETLADGYHTYTMDWDSSGIE